MIGTSTGVWLYVRDGQSVRVVLEAGTLAIYGPGSRFRELHCADLMDATLLHAAIEQQLVQEGWCLEGLTTERRSGRDRRGASRGAPDRRRALRVVDPPINRE